MLESLKTYLSTANPLEMIILAAAFVLVLALWFGVMIIWSMQRATQSRKVHQRLGLEEGDDGRELRLWHDGQEAVTVVPGIVRTSTSQRLGEMIRHAGFSSPPAAVILRLLGVMVLASAVLWSFTGRTMLAAGVAAAIAMGFYIYLRHRISAQESLFERQLVEGLDLAARSLRAGHPLVGSFRVIAQEVPAPVGLAFERIVQQQQMGVSLEDAMRQVADSSTSEDLRLFATSVGIQLRSGGNLADMMDRLSDVMRERMKLNRRARVLVAQTQFSKRLLLAMPLAVFLAVNMINPEYLRPLYTTGPGRWMLGIAGSGLIIGAWMMNRMAKIKT